MDGVVSGTDLEEICQLNIGFFVNLLRNGDISSRVLIDIDEGIKLTK